MDFDLTNEQALVQQTARDFAREEVAPRAARLTKRQNSPTTLLPRCQSWDSWAADSGGDGGAGADTVSYALAVEEISRADASTGITMAAHVSLGTMPFLYFGTEAQKRKYIPSLAAGEHLWAFGLTEPNAGSDAGATETRAELRDGKWIINGSKSFITNSGTTISAGVTITAVTGTDSDGKPEISNIIVPRDAEGYSVSKGYHKMGGERRIPMSWRSVMHWCRGRTCLVNVGPDSSNS